MTDKWKAFWKGVLGALVFLGGLIAALFFTRKSPSKGSPEDIKEKSDAEIEKKRQEIKADSDQALADRFNRLAQKKENKP